MIGTMNTFIDVVLERCAAPQRHWLTLFHEGQLHKVSSDELDRRIQAYAALYRQRSLRPGDVVLIILKESTDLFAAFFAGIVTGVLPAFYAYPSPKQSQERFLEHVVNLVRFNEVSLVISYNEVIAALEKTRLFAGQPYFRGFVQFSDVENKPFDLKALRDESLDEAFLQFSSGTTGAKKGVKITVAALFNQIRAYEKEVFLTEASQVVSWLPHYHDMGLIACMLMPFVKGAHITMLSPFEWVKRPEMLLDMISAVKGTHVWLPNFALGHLVNSIPADQAGRYTLGSLTHIVLCSEPALKATVDQFVAHFAKSGVRREQMVNCYAMAENTFAITTTMAGGIRTLGLPGKGGDVLSCGRPLANVQLRIVEGQVQIKSDCMLKEYHGNPVETRQAFTDDGWFLTGDLGFMDQGELFITGRKKDVIIVGGENIYPQDIEEILNAHPQLLPGRNLVFGIPNPRSGTEKIVVLAEAKEEARHSPVRENLCQDLRQSILDRFNISISEILLLSHQTIKKSTAGKVSRSLNKEAYLAGGFKERDMATPGVSRENSDGSRFLPVVKALLQEERVDAASISTVNPDTQLIRSGLIDSFSFVALVMKIEETAQVKFPADMVRVEHFDTLRDIERTVGRISGFGQGSGLEHSARRKASLEGLLAKPPAVNSQTWQEWLVARFPFPKSKAYIFLLRMIGLQVGWNVSFLGNLFLKVRGKAENIIIEDGVRIGKDVDMRNRENGRIILRRGSFIDDGVRLIAAREGMIEFGPGSEIGRGSIINSGGTVRLGRYVMIGGNVNINSSSHGIAPDAFIKDQPHVHGAVDIGDDVWIGSGASILINSVIGEGAVIGSNSLVSGHIPAFAVCGGIPAKVLRYR